jgi:hypothetical protein
VCKYHVLNPRLHLMITWTPSQSRNCRLHPFTGLASSLSSNPHVDSAIFHRLALASYTNTTHTESPNLTFKDHFYSGIRLFRSLGLNSTLIILYTRGSSMTSHPIRSKRHYATPCTLMTACYSNAINPTQCVIISHDVVYPAAKLSSNSRSSWLRGNHR